MNTRNMVVAAKDFTIDDDGRLDLDHISVGVCSKRIKAKAASRSIRFGPKGRI